MDKTISKEDIDFFRHMLESGENKLKNYKKLLKDQSSKDYKRFIIIYQNLSPSLLEREKYVLDLIYGINDKPQTLKQIALKMGLSANMIRNIRVYAERKLIKEMFFVLNPEKRNQRYFSEIIKSQPDDILLKIGQATRPWERIVKQYHDLEPTKSRRKRLEDIIYRMWALDILDHREKTLKILNVKKEDIKK